MWAKMSNEPGRTVDLPKAAVEALWQGNVIGAITIVRQERKVGLKEAKELVEAYIGARPALHKKTDKMLVEVQQKFIRWLIGFLVLVAGVVYLAFQIW
jgi:ribosomal protein L7/L12